MCVFSHLKAKHKLILFKDSVCTAQKTLLLPANIQDVYKWMVQFQKLTRNLFLTLHGPVSKMASQQEKAFYVLRFEVSGSVITVHETHATL